MTGIEKWRGYQVHCHNYRVPEPFTDQVFSFTPINFIFFSSIVIRNIVKPNIYTRFNIEFMKVIKLAKVIHSESIFDLNKICFKT